MADLASQVVVAHLLRCEPSVVGGFIQYTEPEAREDDEAIVFAGGKVDLVQRGLDAGLDEEAARREAVAIFDFVDAALRDHAAAVERIRAELPNISAERIKILLAGVE